MTEIKYVAYLRVSTPKQGFSGLGLEAQREIIHNYLKDTVPIAEYIEVEIVFCDFPQANKMVLHIISAISQYEAELIAARTKASLQAKKARGFKLGNPEHLLDKHEQAIRNSIKTCKAKADSNPNNKRAIAMLRTLVKEEHTLQELADFLNTEGFVTSNGCSFSKSTIYKLIKRYDLK
jgi:DNA invertase Pin-like site-specific DNA recombinase